MAPAASIPERRAVRRLSAALALPAMLVLGACQSAAPAPYVCLLAGEQRMLVAELFFGRAIRGRGDLTDAEWAKFAADIITPNFPDGFTVFDGDGQWRGPGGSVARERTKIVLVAARRAPDLAGRLEAVIEAYKTRFHQQSVGVVTRDSCAAF